MTQTVDRPTTAKTGPPAGRGKTPATPEVIAELTAEQPVEIAEFVKTLDTIDPNGFTACPSRTAHLLSAHVAGNYLEITRHVEAYLAGAPLARTRTFDEREPEFRTKTSPQLIESIVDGEARLRAAMSELLALDHDPIVRWTNRRVHAVGFLKHSRSECAVHRWDIVGDDEVSLRLLSQEELFRHLVEFVGPIPMTARGMATGVGQGASLKARVRAPGQPDAVIGVHRGVPSLVEGEPHGQALVEAVDPAARLLFLWGRKPTPFHRLRTTGTGEELSRLQWLLSGY
ncbi:maleylpyruvate isomerase N-terminal domain-containing protein [Actinokineospora inagensis]|uniref:maleylpyruvate isomerase N-terminal domain-containing protein n=1 Tax=Actinokineospora inagensis TaxID=103730 RepID=UPI000423BDB6|nr:maleylpyruvate isomerase N-terminal domain-containing protein [Actinokineospora inagensis]